MVELELGGLRDAVRNATAIRAVSVLDPAGGRGDKVFPPTYMKEGRAETKYAIERRRIGEREVQTVLLDSVASQANRMEEALLEAWRRKEIDFPVISVDFSGEEGLADLGAITSLDAPHRIADALLRDSMSNGTLFRLTDAGRAFTDARTNSATGMYRYCPTALILGIWDSTGPKGGMGARFQRCLVSEVVGVDAVTGVKTASRIDPAAIQKGSGPVYVHADGTQEWTHDPAEAKREKKEPVAFSRGGKDSKGSPAAINHGNIPPTIDAEAGGVTIDHAVQTVVLSLAGLRRLRFPLDYSGAPIDGSRRDEVELAARTALAALAVAGVVLLRDRGFDLRSRSLLVPRAPLALEIVDRDGVVTSIAVSRERACALVNEAGSAAAALGLAWAREPITLTPTAKLAHLIRKSRELASAGVDEGEGQ